MLPQYRSQMPTKRYPLVKSHLRAFRTKFGVPFNRISESDHVPLSQFKNTTRKLKWFILVLRPFIEGISSPLFQGIDLTLTKLNICELIKFILRLRSEDSRWGTSELMSNFVSSRHSGGSTGTFILHVRYPRREPFCDS